MFERFAVEAKLVLNTARAESQRLRHEWLGAEHLLLALLAVSDGLAPEVLREPACDPGEMRKQVDRSAGSIPLTFVGHGQIPFTRSAKEALHIALTEADALGHPKVGTGHLLIGLMAGPESIAADVLRTRNITLEMVRAKVIEHGGWDAPAEPVASDTGSRMHVLRQAVAVLRAIGETDTAVQVERALHRLT